MDILLKFPTRALAVEFGKSMGASKGPNGEADGFDPAEAVTETLVQTIHGVLAIDVVGEHQKQTGTQSKMVKVRNGEELVDEEIIEPVFSPAAGWWVLVRAEDGYPIPYDDLAAIGAEVIERDPENPNPDVPGRAFL